MTTLHVRPLTAVAVATVLALTACGGSGGDDPTTNSVEDHAQTEAAKRSSTTTSGSASQTPSSSGSKVTASPSEPSASSSSAASSSREPLPHEPTDKAQVRASTSAVRKYLSAYNAAVRDPARRSEMNQFVAAGCKSCADLMTIPDGLAKRKQKFVGDAITWRSSEAQRTDNSNAVEIFVTFDQLPTDVVDEKGKLVARPKRKDGLEKAFQVTHADGSYRISEIRESV